MPSDLQLCFEATKLMAALKPFNQPAQLCSALVAWWLRARIKNKPFFAEKYFEREFNLKLHGSSPDGFAMRPEGKFVAAEKGTAKASALQTVFTDSGDRAQIQKYITAGRREDKPDKEGKDIARLVRELPATPIGNPAGDRVEGICNSFREAFESNYLVRYSLITSNSHSVGLDGSDNSRIVYFDPNLGEFTFWNIIALCCWWEKCYLTRTQQRNAFTSFGNTFRAEYYWATKS